MAARRNYRLTDQVEQVLRSEFGRTPTREIARRLGWSTKAVTRAARKLGLPSRNKGWDVREQDLLVHCEGSQSVRAIADQLGRSPNAVLKRMHRSGMSGRIQADLTAGQVAECLGVSKWTAARWIKRGWLEATRQHSRRAHSTWQVSEAALLRFIRDHGRRLDCSRVDRTWLTGVVLADDLSSSKSARLAGMDLLTELAILA